MYPNSNSLSSTIRTSTYSTYWFGALLLLKFKHQAAFLRATHPDACFHKKHAAFELVTKQYTDKQLIEGTM